VLEHADEGRFGTVTLRTSGRVLPARLYAKDHAQLEPGVAVEHKHLDGVFGWIAAQQQARDAVRLANPKISGREKQGIRAGSPPRTAANAELPGPPLAKGGGLIMFGHG
jgi:hypothetical protein